MLRVENSAHAWRELLWGYTRPRRFWHVFHLAEWYSTGGSGSCRTWVFQSRFALLKNLSWTPLLLWRIGWWEEFFDGREKLGFWFRVRFRVKCCWLSVGIVRWTRNSLGETVQLAFSRRLRLIWSLLLFVSQRLIYPSREIKKQMNQPRMNMFTTNNRYVKRKF